MKLVKLIMFLAICIGIRTAVWSAPGCMSKSRGLSVVKYDYKTYEKVPCTCPCGKSPQYKIIADRGYCIKCQHYRDPQQFILIKPNGIAKPVIGPFERFIKERKSFDTKISSLRYTTEFYPEPVEGQHSGQAPFSEHPE